MQPRDNKEEINPESRPAIEAIKDRLYGDNAFSGNANTSIPINVSTNGDIERFYNQQLPFMKEHLSDTYPEQQKHPGVLRTAYLDAKLNSDIGHFANLIEDTSYIRNPYSFPQDPNWNPTSNPSNLVGLDNESRAWALGADNEFEQQRRQQVGLQRQSEQQELENGSALGKIIGFGMTAVASPTMWIGIAHGLRYPKLSESVLSAAGRAVPGIALSAVSHEALAETSKIGGNLKDFIVNAGADTAFGVGFMGILGAVEHTNFMNKLWQTRKMVAPIFDGIEYKPRIGENGEIESLVAVDTTGSLSAAKVFDAQKMADSAMAKNGIFSIPYIGEGTSRFLSLVSPGMRGLNSTFESVRTYTDRIFSHGFITKGIERGEAAPIKFDDIMAQTDAANTQDYIYFQGLHAAMNGVNPSKNPIKQGIQNAKIIAKEYQQPVDYVSKAEFSKRVRNVLINEVPDEAVEVNDAAQRYRKTTDDLFDKVADLYGIDRSLISSRTSRGYMMRIFNVPFLEVNRNTWVTEMSGWLKESDQLINTRMQPIRDLEERLTQAKADHDKLVFDKTSMKRDIEESDNKVNDIAQNIKLENMLLENELRTDESWKNHLDDNWRLAVSSDEAEQISAIRKPVNEVKSKINVVARNIDDKKSVVDSTKKAILKHQKTIKRVKDEIPEDRVKREKHKETVRKNVELRDEAIAEHTQAKEELKVLEDEHRGLEQNADDMEQMIYDDMREGKIKSNLYYKDNEGKFILKDPNNRLKLRKEYESHHQREVDAHASLDSILNQTAEDTVGQIFNKMMGHGSPDMLKRRSIMAPDTLLHENNFLSSDVSTNLMVYRKSMMKKIALKSIFPDVTIENDIHPMANHLHDEFKARDKILQDKDKKLTEKRDKETNKEKKDKISKDILANKKDMQNLNKDFNDNKVFMAAVYEKMMGRSGLNKMPNSKLTKMVRGLSNFTQASLLGWVPFTQMVDLMGLVFKHGLFPFIRDGIMPMFESWNGMRGTPQAEAYSKNAGHLGLALNNTMKAYQDKNMMGFMQQDIPMQKWYSADRILHGVEWAAHQTGNLAGTNYIDNFLQRVSANITQSRIIDFMQQFEAGTLSEKDLQKMLIFGLDPKEWSSRFLASWKEAGEDGNGWGGYNSHYYKWEDTEAAHKMGQTIFRAVRDSVLTRRGMLDAPFLMDTPFGMLQYQFKGYMFNSITRYVVPLMQNPDREKLLGTMVMFSAGMMQTPLRQMAKGQDIDTDPKHMLFRGFEESGVGTFPMQVLEMTNILLNGKLLKDFQNPRYAQISKIGAGLGPSAGLASTWLGLMNNIISGETNQADLKKTAHTMWPGNLWEFSRIVDNVLDTLDIPKNKREAKAMKGS